MYWKKERKKGEKSEGGIKGGRKESGEGKKEEKEGRKEGKRDSHVFVYSQALCLEYPLCGISQFIS